MFENVSFCRVVENIKDWLARLLRRPEQRNNSFVETAEILAAQLKGGRLK
jgi:hypothetical protein